MRYAFLFFAAIFLSASAAATNVTYYPDDLGCWVTPYFRYSQPWYYPNIVIPENATQVLITTLEGAGTSQIYNLRACEYTACTTYNYYNNFCPVITQLVFGTINLTQSLPPGRYFLTMDSIIGVTSRQFAYSAITVYFDNFSFSKLNESYDFYNFNGSSTLFSTEVNVMDKGQCSLPVPAPSDASQIEIKTTNGSQQVFVYSSGSISWSCKQGDSPYYISWHLPVVQLTQAWQQIGTATFSSQLFASTLEIFNPAQQQSYVAVPFSFSIPEHLFLVNGSVNGSISLAAMERKTVTRFFNASVISTRSYLSADGVLDNVTIASSLLIYNNFSLSPVLLAGSEIERYSRNLTIWPCSEGDAEVQPLSSVTLNCVSFTALNFSVIGNSSLVVDNPFSFPIFLHDIPATLDRLTGLHYSVVGGIDSINLLPNSTLTVNVSLIVENVSLPENETATELLLAEQISGSNGQLKLGSDGANSSVEEGRIEPNETESEEPSIAFPESNTPRPPNEAAQANQPPSSPAVFSFFATALDAAPFALFGLLLLAVPFIVRKKKLFTRKLEKDGIVKFTIFNSFSAPMEKIILEEILPADAKPSKFSEKPTSEKTVIGQLLKWKRKILKPGEEWNITYGPGDSKPKRSRLSYFYQGERKAIFT